MADVRPIAVDDADSIIRAFHRSIKTGKEEPLLPNLTPEQQAKFEKAQKELNDLPEKRKLDDEAFSDAAVKKVQTGA